MVIYSGRTDPVESNDGWTKQVVWRVVQPMGLANGVSVVPGVSKDRLLTACEQPIAVAQVHQTLTVITAGHVHGDLISVHVMALMHVMIHVLVVFMMCYGC
jgi:hypothetical protein